MKAILEVNKGESPYKIIRSPWLKDKEGPILFKLLSKKRCDGQIEAVFVTERKTHKTILGRTIIPEEKFTDAANAFREGVWQFFPKVDLEIEGVEPVNVDSPKSNSEYTAIRNTRQGAFWLMIKKWLIIL